MAPLDAELREAAQRVLAYLATTDPLPPTPADAIIGFGVFDLELPRFCGELFQRGLAPAIVFTGGIGGGTGTLGEPEADAWRSALRVSHPTIPDAAVVLENRSTNTAENIAFTAERLARDVPTLAFGSGIRTALIVTSPSRMRRAWLTMRQLQPAVRCVRQLPPVSFDREVALYAANGVDYLTHLAGELDRIVSYAARGWIAEEPLAAEIRAAAVVLRRQRRDFHA